eukprot:m.28832 g.28832  ORF g.28832 m.28832 type:complete len:716 (-) comp4601_c0_seq2:66-2213(-)
METAASRTRRGGAGEQRGRGRDVARQDGARPRDTAAWPSGPPARARTEPASSLPPGALKKGANLSHLINFQYTPRERPSPSRAPVARRDPGARAPRFHREEYTKAVCQFLVHEGGDHSVSVVDADAHLEWDDVELVLFRSQAEPCCPVCLGPPVAPQTTRCGHVYCWPCVLHHLAQSGGPARCPICDDTVVAADLRSASMRVVTPVLRGQHVRFLKMERRRDSTIAVPSDMIGRLPEGVAALTAEGVDPQYLKLREISWAAVIDTIVARERTDLLHGDVETDDVFAEQAWQLLHERERRAAARCGRPEPEPTTFAEERQRLVTPLAVSGPTWPARAGPAKSAEKLAPPVVVPPSVPSVPPGLGLTAPDLPEIRVHQGSAAAEVIENPFSDCGLAPMPSSEFSPSPPVPSGATPLSGSAAGPGSANVLFYQSADSQLVYLDALCVRGLCAQYGDLAFCPPALDVVIVDAESHVMTHRLREQYRFLSHLPLGVEFTLCEVALPPLLAPAALATVQPEIRKRAAARRRRAEMEKRREEEIAKSQDWRAMAAAVGAVLPQELPPDFGDFVLDPAGAAEQPALIHAISFSKIVSTGVMADPTANPPLPGRTEAPSTRKGAWGATPVPVPQASAIDSRRPGSSEDSEFTPPSYQASFMTAAAAVPDDVTGTSPAARARAACSSRPVCGMARGRPASKLVLSLFSDMSVLAFDSLCSPLASP